MFSYLKFGIFPSPPLPCSPHLLSLFTYPFNKVPICLSPPFYPNFPTFISTPSKFIYYIIFLLKMLNSISFLRQTFVFPPIIKFAILLIALVIFFSSFLFNLSLPPPSGPFLLRNQRGHLHFAQCLPQNLDFQKALSLQSDGLPRIFHENRRINERATWELIPRHFNGIWHSQLRKLNILRLQSNDENKYFAPFSGQLQRPYPCNVITFGVGHSVWAERNLSQIYPECHFLAVDPASDVNANLVKKDLGGIFIKAAIGGKTMRRTLTNVWEKDVEVKGVERRMVRQLGIFDFLRTQRFSMNPVDLLLVDVEGAEFGIIEQFVENSGQLPMPICQLNMEIHHPNELNPNYTHRRFFDFLDRFMRSRQFALLHTDINDDPRYRFLRFFFINIAHDICIQKFLC